MKQIEQGTPAEMFLSADIDWMDFGAKKNLINNGTRENLLGNRLVLIACLKIQKLTGKYRTRIRSGGSPR